MATEENDTLSTQLKNAEKYLLARINEDNTKLAPRFFLKLIRGDEKLLEGFIRQLTESRSPKIPFTLREPYRALVHQCQSEVEFKNLPEDQKDSRRDFGKSIRSFGIASLATSLVGIAGLPPVVAGIQGVVGYNEDGSPKMPTVAVATGGMALLLTGVLATLLVSSNKVRELLNAPDTAHEVETQKKQILDNQLLDNQLEELEKYFKEIAQYPPHRRGREFMSSQ